MLEFSWKRHIEFLPVKLQLQEFDLDTLFKFLYVNIGKLDMVAVMLNGDWAVFPKFYQRFDCVFFFLDFNNFQADLASCLVKNTKKVEHICREATLWN
jgi:hypothetical protein